MKALATLTLVLGMAMRLSAEPLLTDITTYEALVMDEASGQTLAVGGPWPWEDLSSQTMSGSMSGPGRTIVVKCRNAEGQTIFGGVINNADLTAPFSPFLPPNPSGQVSLTFNAENYTLVVLLNGTHFVGEMLLLPAQDDPVVPTVKTVSVDIKPGSVENPFNLKSKGVTPVVIAGSSAVDVTLIDPASVKLAGVVPLRYNVTDVDADGTLDLVVHFRDQKIAGVLAGAVDGEVVGLKLTGSLLDTTVIEGVDTVTVIRKK